MIRSEQDRNGSREQARRHEPINQKEGKEKKNMAKLITKNEQSISWKELAEGVKAGEIALQQGDTVELKLTTGEIVFMQAVKVSEDGKRVTFVSKDCLATEMPMNEERTNYGGWAESDLRKRLNTEVFNTLPEDLKEVIAITKRRQYVDGKIVECEDKLWIPSEYEIHGREIFAEHVEGEEQFELYKDRRNRMKKVGNNGEDTDWYWCDSPYASNTTDFCHVSSYGNAGNNNASSALAVPLCFEI